MELTDNFFSNNRWTKNSINRLLIRFRDTGAVNRLAGSGGPWSVALKKMLTWLRSGYESRRYAKDSQNGPWNIDNQLSCYEITTMILVAAFYLNTVYYAKNASNLNI